MNTSFKGTVSRTFTAPVTAFLYRDTNAPAMSFVNETKPTSSDSEAKLEQPNDPIQTAQEIDEMLAIARAEAVTETEARLRKEYERKSSTEAETIRRALELFQVERKDYFARIESEVVHLALAIAAKILHRQAQVDPMLVAALVRVAVEKLHDGSSVSVRVPPAAAEKWRACMANPLNGSTIAIVEDDHLGADDCILETDLGSANFSIDAQLKEVEQGFFDLLAQRPLVR